MESHDINNEKTPLLSDHENKQRFFQNKKQRLIFVALCLECFSTYCSFSVLAPFFTLESKRFASGLITGLIFAVYPFILFLVSPLVGKWISHFGVKFTLLSGAFLQGGSLILFGFVTDMESKEVFIVFCFLLRIVTALGGACNETAVTTFMMKTFKHQINTVYGTIEVFTGAGMMTGPALGGFLYKVGGFKLPFLVIGGLTVALIPFLACFLPSSEEHSEDDDGSDEHFNILKVLFIPGVTVDCVVTFIFGLVNSSLEPILTDHLENLMDNGLTSVQVGFIWMIIFSTYACSAPIIGRVVDKKGVPHVAILLGSVGCVLSFLFLGPSPLLTWLIAPDLKVTCIALGCFGVASAGMLIPVLSDMESSTSKAGLQSSTSLSGILSGLFNSSYYLGSFIGPTLTGWMKDETSFAWSTTVIAGINMLELIGVAAAFVVFNCRGA